MVAETKLQLDFSTPLSNENGILTGELASTCTATVKQAKQQLSTLMQIPLENIHITKQGESL